MPVYPGAQVTDSVIEVQKAPPKKLAARGPPVGTSQRYGSSDRISSRTRKFPAIKDISTSSREFSSPVVADAMGHSQPFQKTCSPLPPKDLTPILVTPRPPKFGARLLPSWQEKLHQRAARVVQPFPFLTRKGKRKCPHQLKSPPIRQIRCSQRDPRPLPESKPSAAIP